MTTIAATDNYNVVITTAIVTAATAILLQQLALPMSS
jgi:hypothetical protein